VLSELWLVSAVAEVLLPPLSPVVIDRVDEVDGPGW